MGIEVGQRIEVEGPDGNYEVIISNIEKSKYNGNIQISGKYKNLTNPQFNYWHEGLLELRDIKSIKVLSLAKEQELEEKVKILEKKLEEVKKAVN